MTRFASKEALGELLKSWAPSYEPYAGMFDRGFCDLTQLANVSAGKLATVLATQANQAKDIQHELHAEDIIARAKAVAGGAGTGLSTSAGRGPSTRMELQDRLSGFMTKVEDRVVDGMVYFFAPQLPYANNQLLCKLYDVVKAAPHSNTKAILKKEHGIVFNGPYNSALPARAALLIAFEGRKPVLAKFFADSHAIKSEVEVLTEMWREPAVPGIVGPVKLLTLGSGNVITGSSGSRATQVRYGMSMPLYPATLQHLPRPMDAADVLECARQLKNTLDGIHNKGYGHNDVKAGNVFLDNEGMCVLGDFGSARKLGSIATEHTPTHWPAAFESDTPSVDHTCKAADYFCLAVTLLERAGKHELCSGPTPAMLRLAVAQLTEPAEQDLRDFILQLLPAPPAHV